MALKSCFAIPPINKDLGDITPINSSFLSTHVPRQGRRTARALDLGAHASLVCVLRAYLADDSLISQATAAAWGSSRNGNSRNGFLALFDGSCGGGRRSGG
ncbi:hypothetical protein LB507_007808 [Fusarium sp. FIESC RH6]|nr:hypothetical protein LB507_007808 [Fusarium sp. FIESC RH6]